MKKYAAVFLSAGLLLCGTAAAENEVLTPVHAVSMDNYGEEDCTLNATFDIAAALDDQYCLTYNVSLPDLYDGEKVLALQPGDRFIAFGEEMQVETVDIEDEAVAVNGESGVYFCMEDGMEGMMVCDDYTETISAETVGPYTFPLADSVRLVTYRMDADGNLLDGMDEQNLTPAETKAFFAEHGDMDKPNYLSAFGSATTVRVKDGKVIEIVIDWSSDS